MANRLYEYPQLMEISRRAIASGAEFVSPAHIKWDISGGCADSYFTEMRSRRRSEEFGDIPLTISLYTRCRRCDKCRRHRMGLWRARAKAETLEAYRTWFGTLTLRQSEQDKFLAMARHTAAQSNSDFDAYDFGEQFRKREAEIAPEVTRMWKRMRKGGMKFRYLLVAEAHKSGGPHYHCLVHQSNIDNDITYRQLAGQWPLGFTKYNLVLNTKQATYLCKYLAKTLAARVRASRGYGSGTESLRPIDILKMKDESGKNRPLKNPIL